MNDMAHEVNHGQGGSKNKLWIFGGIGCVLVLLLCVGGIGTIAYLAMDVVGEQANIEGSLVNSEAVSNAVGSPVNVEHDPQPKPSGAGDNAMVFAGKVSGPDGEGTYEARIVMEGFGFELESLTVKVDGETIDVSGEDEMDLGIELGE